MRKRVLVFCDYYLPSYKSGGGMWTVVNLVERFCDRYDFFIVARNYDSKTDKNPFTTVKTDEWNQTGSAKVFYFSPKNLKGGLFATLAAEVKPDAIFLNSVFATPVIKFLMLRRNGKIADIPVILAPCGELSAEALSLKPLKKQAFLKTAKLINLHRNIIWKASGEAEKEEVKRVIGKGVEILVAPDLTPKTILPEYSQSQKLFKEKGQAKFVFCSRIVRKKNIRFFLERLREINSGKIVLTIVGPPEDADYAWECEKISKTLPPNISVIFAGAFPYQQALKKVFESHFFVLPTLNENFGYVCIEALAAGCPLLLSDRTVWSDLENYNAGWQLPLEEAENWVGKIKDCVEMDNSEYQKMSSAARNYSIEWLAKPGHEKETGAVLERATEGNTKSFKRKM
ncbi:MAG: hypothetical protein JWN60_651 [Acidobacteria bacterium]|nr:hypothetical protein [Acidobacteriota bacterium]